MNLRNYLLFSCIVMLFAFQSACSTHCVSNKIKNREALMARIDQLWKARMSNDRKTIYTLADLNYKAEVPLDTFLKKPGLAIKKYSVLDVAVSGDEATCEISFETKIMGVWLNTKNREKWLFEKSAWHLNLSAQSKESPFGPMATPHK